MKKERLIILTAVILVLAVLTAAFYVSFPKKLSVRVIDTEQTSCADSDGGKQNYKKGITTGKGEEFGIVKNFTDFCFNNSITAEPIEKCSGVGCKVNEYYCGFKNFVYEVELLCPKGCKNGACLSSKSVQEEETEQSGEIQEQENQKESGQVNEPEIEETETKSPSIYTKILDFFKRLFNKG